MKNGLKSVCAVVLVSNVILMGSADESINIGMDYPPPISGGISTSSGASDINVNDWDNVQPQKESRGHIIKTTG